MKKELRVKDSIEFQDIIKKSRYISNKSFVVYYRPKKERQARFGVSVGKKIGNAVKRNKLKRQLRSMLQHLSKEYEYSFDSVIIVRNGFLSNDYNTNLTSLENLLNKIEKEN